MKTIVRRAVLAGLLAVGAVAPAAGAALAQSPSITVSSTTSTQDSGLFGSILPLFKAKTGIEARIVAACDTWHAMTSSRSYRQAMSHQVALDELRSVAGSQLDPRIVEVLVGLLEAR